MSYTEKKLYSIIAWTVFGCILAFIGTAFGLTGKISLNPFYDVGSVWEIPWREFHSTNIQEKGHREQSGHIVLDEGEYRYNFYNFKGKYKYFIIDIDDLQSDNLQLYFDFSMEKDGEVIETDKFTVPLHEGQNIVNINIKKINKAFMIFQGDKGGSFRIVSMQFRKSPPVFSVKKACIIFLGIFCIYVVITILLRKFLCKFRLNIRPKWDPFESLQSLYIIIIMFFTKRLHLNNLSEKSKRILRTSLFSFMFLYSQYIDINHTYRSDFQKHLLFYIIMTILIILVTAEGKLEKHKWNRGMVYAWAALWGTASVVDIFVSGAYKYAAIVMFLIMPAFYFVWNNMKNKYDMIRDIMNAVHIYFFVCVLFCIFCRPETASIRYCGISTNPAITGICMGTVAIAGLAELEMLLKKGRHFILQFLVIMEIIIAITFCWKAQGAAPLLLFLLFGALWISRSWNISVRMRRKRNFFAIILCLILLAAPVYGSVTWGINNIPFIFNTEKVFEGDNVADKDEGFLSKVVYASENESGDNHSWFTESRLGKKFQDLSFMRIINARENYYKTYMRNLNLWGHSDFPKMWGHRRMPHNAVLGISYRYGIFTSVPYIVIIFVWLVQSYKLSRKREGMCIPLYMIFAVILMSTVDNIEQPYVWLPWFVLYYLGGCCFLEADENDSI